MVASAIFGLKRLDICVTRVPGYILEAMALGSLDRGFSDRNPPRERSPAYIPGRSIQSAEKPGNWSKLKKNDLEEVKNG